MAGKLQSEHPNPCQLSADGNFGSKFVTVVMSGDKENQIHPEGYQVRPLILCFSVQTDDNEVLDSKFTLPPPSSSPSSS